MRRISLALALVGAVAATGCGKTSTSNDGGGNRGVAQGTFNVTVQNGQNGNTSLAITGGYVTSVPAGIDCGVSPHSACSVDFAAGTTVTLTATPISGYNFWSYAGDCYTTGNVCTLTGKAADQYVLAKFGSVNDNPTAHPDWISDPSLHATQAQTYLSTVPLSSTFVFQCGDCHGSALTGMGLAPSCAKCHGGSSQVVAPATTAVGETCANCHNNSVVKQGAEHQALYNQYTDATTLTETIDNVASTANGDGTFKLVVTFTVKKSGAAYDITKAGKTSYNAVQFLNGAFDYTTAASFGKPVATATAGQYTVTAAAAKYDILAAGTNAFVYFYVVASPPLYYPDGNYYLSSDVASVAQVFGTINYTSTANVSACENCHGVPYQKHGYRQAKVAGLPDFVSCKACHTDNRPGNDTGWQCLVETPAAAAAGTCNTTTQFTSGYWTYQAKLMNDVHMSHSMEFEYPQSMANCATCHSGKLDQVLADANMKFTTCKSCHPVTSTNTVFGERPPPLNPAGTPPAVLPAYHTITRASDGTGTVSGHDCNYCHNDQANSYDPVTHTVTYWTPADPQYADGKGPTFCFDPPTCSSTAYVPLFKEIHTGYNSEIYADNQGTRYTDAFTSAVATASVASNVLTFTATVTQNNAGLSGFTSASVKPQFYVIPFGYDTKDFIQNSVNCNTTGTCTGWTFSPSTVGNTTTWTVTYDLTKAGGTGGYPTWTSQIANGAIKRLQIGFKPILKDATGLTVAQNAPTRVFDVGANAFADSFYTEIVSAAKCNKCHDALGTTFHDGARGGNVAFCRTCHNSLTGAGYLEMQSREISSFVHAIHEFQGRDIKNVNFADPVQAMEYEDLIGSTYPNFTLTNCESCHNPGTYEVPDNSKSLPAILSASATLTGTTRAINGVPSVVTGPAATACGGCHRAYLIKNDQAAALQSFSDHTKAFGYREVPADATQTTTTVLQNVMKAIFGTY